MKKVGRLIIFIALTAAAGSQACWAQFSVSVNAADYMPAAAVSLDFGVARLTDNFDPARFFLVDVRNTSGHAVAIKEHSTAVQPTFWVQGASINGQFTLKPNEVRTIRVRAKSNVEGKYEGAIEWASPSNAAVFRLAMDAFYGPTVKESTQDLPHIEACCYKDWTRKDVTLPIPDNYRLTGFDSPNNWGPDNLDRCCGWRETSYVVNGQLVLVHYGIQADEKQFVADQIVNKRGLTPRIHMTFGLLESSIGFSVTAPGAPVGKQAQVF
jgi:hypothetical protein